MFQNILWWSRLLRVLCVRVFLIGGPLNMSQLYSSHHQRHRNTHTQNTWKHTCYSRWAHWLFGSLCYLHRSLCQHQNRGPVSQVIALCRLWKQRQSTTWSKPTFKSITAIWLYRGGRGKVFSGHAMRLWYITTHIHCSLQVRTGYSSKLIPLATHPGQIQRYLNLYIYIYIFCQQ